MLACLTALTDEYVQGCIFQLLVVTLKLTCAYLEKNPWQTIIKRAIQSAAALKKSQDKNNIVEKEEATLEYEPELTHSEARPTISDIQEPERFYAKVD